MTFDVSTNWTQGVYDKDNSASDGFSIFIDNLPMHSSVPAFVPADMSALVVLAQPKKLLETTNCLSDTMPKLHYFDSYDAHGSYCVMDALLKVTKNLLNCEAPLSSYIPLNNVTCNNYDQLTFLNLALYGDFMDGDTNPAMKKAQDLVSFYML